MMMTLLLMILRNMMMIIDFLLLLLLQHEDLPVSPPGLIPLLGVLLMMLKGLMLLDSMPLPQS
jgi:hypothetical protein